MKAKAYAMLLLASASPVPAADFRFDASNSQLGFTGDYGGELVPGVFKAFSGTASFDASQPLATRFSTDIDVASLDTDYPDRDETLRDPDFFDSERHPKARWVSSGDCSAAGARLLCPGMLTLKGQTHPVPLDISPGTDGKSIVGKASFARSEFAIGSGDWADPETIADQVEVQFTLQLR